MPLIVLLLLLVGCAAPRGPWIVQGASWDAQPYADAAEKITGDRKDWIKRGGEVIALPDLNGLCFANPGKRPSGCSEPGLVYVLSGVPVDSTALAHEFCHLGLARGGGYSGPVIEATEDQADACSLLVHGMVP